MTSEDLEQGPDRCRVGLFGKDLLAHPKLLSIKAGLRAKEIASLTWRMVTDARGYIGRAIHLEDTASKGEGSGRSHRQAEQADTAPATRGFGKARGREALTDIGRTFA
jgi:hypothetical protein